MTPAPDDHMAILHVCFTKRCQYGVSTVPRPHQKPLRYTTRYASEALV